jgi:hypothetical protein
MLIRNETGYKIYLEQNKSSAIIQFFNLLTIFMNFGTKAVRVEATAKLYFTDILQSVKTLRVNEICWVGASRLPIQGREKMYGNRSSNNEQLSSFFSYVDC